MTTRLALPNRRNHITQKLKIAGQQTLYISVLDDDRLAEFFLRLKGPVCSSELTSLYHVVARLMGLALQYGAAYLLGAWSRCMSHNPGRPTTNPSGFSPCQSRGLRNRGFFHRSTSWKYVSFPLLSSPDPAHERSHKHTEPEQHAGNDQDEHDVEQGISLLGGPGLVISPRS